MTSAGCGMRNNDEQMSAALVMGSAVVSHSAFRIPHPALVGGM